MRLLILYALLLCQGPLMAVQSGRPNFIVILTDDQTFRAIGYNNPIVKTPNLDRLAANGVRFDRAYVATPICAASRASLLTGMYAQANGSVALDNSAFRKHVVEKRLYKTLASQLAEHGYSTLFFGKSHLGNPQDYGFAYQRERFDFNDSTNFRELSHAIGAGNLVKQPFLLWLATGQPHVPLKPSDYWLDRHPTDDIPLDPNFRVSPDSSSFFNQGLPGEIYFRDTEVRSNHAQLSAGPPRDGRQMREFTRAYYATISHLDAQLGELFSMLSENGLLENTVIVFTSDNGYMLGNHGLGNKIVMFEESVRVPFFIYWDKRSGTGRRIEEVVSTIDIYPTLLELAGASASPQVQGYSLAPYILSKDVRPIRQYVASECTGVGGRLGDGHRMIATKEWKYILSDTNEEALFDLRSDPYELSNLIDDPSSKNPLVQLRGYLRSWRELVNDKKEW